MDRFLSLFVQVPNIKLTELLKGKQSIQNKLLFEGAVKVQGLQGCKALNRIPLAGGATAAHTCVPLPLAVSRIFLSEEMSVVPNTTPLDAYYNCQPATLPLHNKEWTDRGFRIKPVTGLLNDGSSSGLYLHIAC